MLLLSFVSKLLSLKQGGNRNMQHFITQLPYELASAFIASIMFIIAGIFI